jgi:hypothetical protein
MKKKLNCHLFKTGYLDESGDNGKKGSGCLILTYMCTDDGKKIAKVLKKAKTNLRRIKKGKRWLNKRHGGEIKFTGFPDQRILIKTLEELSKLDLQIRFIAIHKNGNIINPSEKSQILLGEGFESEKCMPHKIVADKDYFDNKKIAYLAVKDYKEIDYSSGEKKNLDKIGECDLRVSIKHENSRENIGLQAVDLISGAIFQEIEKKDKSYTDILQKNLDIKGALLTKLKK